MMAHKAPSAGSANSAEEEMWTYVSTLCQGGGGGESIKEWASLSQ